MATEISNMTRFNMFTMDVSTLMRDLTIEDKYADSQTTTSHLVTTETRQLLDEESLTVSNKMICITCSLDFEEREEQVAHFGSDWHRFNLKRKVEKGLSAVSREKFEDMADDVSSISGSDSESDSDSESANRADQLQESDDVLFRRSPFVYFRNAEGELLSIYRCTLVDKQFEDHVLSSKAALSERTKFNITHQRSSAANQNALNLVTKALNLATGITGVQQWAVLMVGGGHFAGSVFKRSDILVRKTFHRYTIRAKRGTSQGLHDQKGSMAKSAGASLRRYNEAALVQEIQDLLSSWRDELAGCTKIYLRAPHNKSVFYGGKNPAFSKYDSRISMIPFPTRRPTMSEVKRVQATLATVLNYGHVTSLSDVVLSPKRQSQSIYAKSTKGQGQGLPSESKAQTSDREIKGLKSTSQTKGRSQTADTKDQRSLSDTKCQRSWTETKGQKPPSELGQEDDDSSEGDVGLCWNEEILTTDHLRDFECTKKPRRRKKKTPIDEKKVETPPPPAADILPTVDQRLRDRVYTACKTGNIKMLMSIATDLPSPTSLPGNAVTSIVDLGSSQIPRQMEEIVRLPNQGNELPGNSDLGRELPSCNNQENELPGNSNNTRELPSNSDLENELPSNRKNESRTCRDQSFGHDDTGLLSNTEPVKIAASNDGQDDDGLICNTKSEDFNDSPLPSNDEYPYSLPEVILLLKFGNKEESMLHVTSRAEHTCMTYQLLQMGADPALKDLAGLVPYVVSRSKAVRNEYRRFMSVYPSRYDYETAQIPAPLTESMEAERKVKENERKKIAKKAKKERQKGQKELEVLQEAEHRDKERFLKLSDREKRALAAERRILDQAQADGYIKPVLSRCWQCGQDISGKTPFEYYDYKFCASKCLRQHRNDNKQPM